MSDYRWDWGPYALNAECQKRFLSHDHDELLKICDVIDVRNRKGSSRTSGFVPVHYEDGKLYVLKGESHSRVCGESGSKKSRTISRGCIIASALCGHSMVITDPKGELYGDPKIRGILREEGYDVRCLNFRTMDGDGINILGPAYDLLAEGNLQASDAYINRFIAMLTANIGSPNQDPFWNNNAGQIIVSIIRMLRNLLLMQDDRERFHWASIVSFLRQDKENLESMFSEMARNAPARDPISDFYNYIQASADRTYSSLILTAQSLLANMNFSDSLLRMLCFDTFSMGDLYSKKLAVFLQIPDETKCYDQVAGYIINIFYEALVQEYAAKYEGRRKKPPHNVNFICDEVATIHLHDLNSMASAARSRCISFVFIYQSEAQMQLVYPEYATVVGNCRNYIFLGSSEHESLSNVSQAVGQSYLSADGAVPMVSVNDLRCMKKQRKYKEALITVGNYVLCASLPDYDVYPFLKYTRVRDEKQSSLPQRIYLYTPEEVVADYRSGKIHLPGSRSVNMGQSKCSNDSVQMLVDDFDKIYEKYEENWEE